jgi:hypothetical protein
VNSIEMPSQSLLRWSRERADALDEIRDAHSAIGGHGRGRRYATQQVNHAYVVLLSSQFQGFCRDLHSEAADFLITRVQPASLQQVLRARFTEGRKLDSGNPNPGNLGADFGRLGIEFWAMVSAIDRRNLNRKKELEKLNHWRNAIAHQDLDRTRLQQLTGKSRLVLKDVGLWRSVCTALAQSFDRAVQGHIKALVGAAPW